MDKATEITNRLTDMSHLGIPESTDDLKEEVAEIVNPAPKVEGIDPNDPKTQREYTFQFNWKDGRGKVWSGEFTNKVLSIRDRQMVGVMRARMAGGTPLESLDALTVEINLMVAHLTFSLETKPKWAEDLRDIDDVRLLQEIYGEVASHEATFLGWGETTA